MNWLVFLSVSLPPIGGILIGDFFLKWRGRYPALEDYPFRSVNGAALIAWGVAIAASKLSPPVGVFSVAPLNAIVVAALVYAAADRLLHGPAPVPAEEPGC